MKTGSMKYEVGSRDLFLMIIVFILASCSLLLTPTPILAQTDYQLLAPIPLAESGCSGNESGNESCKTKAGPYIQGIFKLIIAIAGGLAVAAIIFGGITYMSTDAFEGKSEAKTTIQNAIWGLLLATSAWLILNTINPKLVNFDLRIPAQPIPDSAVSGDGVRLTGLGGLPLTQQEALNVFEEAGIVVVGRAGVAGVRQGIVDELILLKNECNCDVLITSATGGSHTSSACSHANGYKIDLRSRGQGTVLTNYIQTNYRQLPNRSDGAKMYLSPTGVPYALEGNHWDVARC